MFSKEIFAQRLLLLRTAQRASQADLARYAGVSRTTITMIESGQRAASIEVACAIADYFDVSLDYIVGRSNNSSRY